MGLRVRLILILLSLIAMTLCQEWQLQDASASRTQGDADLRRPIEDFPIDIGEWQGTDIETTRPEFLYGDAHVHRSYTDSTSGRTVTLWMAHSATGEDRFHHPEVCMQASGHRDVSELRSKVTMDLASGPAPAEHFVFEKLTDRRRVHVVYWHYSLAGDATEKSLFRTGGLRRASSDASLTVELFAHDRGPGDATAVRELSVLIDALLKDYLPPTAVRGNQRYSFMMIRDAQWIGR